jgi:hypothetical protein
MDILNFISWIRGGRQVTTVDPAKTLLPVGLKDPKRDDGYLAGAISVDDFAAQVGGLQTVSVDGVTITGDGTPGDPLVAAGGGGFDPTNIDIAEVNVINATEGTSIPDGASATYIKTIPLGFATVPTKVLAVFSVNSIAQMNNVSNQPYLYGVTSEGRTGYSPSSTTAAIDSPLRMLVTSDYTQAKRAQLMSPGSPPEADENGNSFPTINILGYTDFPTLFGVYNNGTNRGMGYTNSDPNNTQSHSVIKSAYLSGNNLVIMFKKRAATTGEFFSTAHNGNQGIYLRVYKLV